MSTGARLLPGLNFRMQAMHPEPMQEAHSSHVPRLTASHAVSPRSLINSTFQPSLHRNSPLNSSGGKKCYSLIQSFSGFPMLQVKCKSFPTSRPSTILPHPSLLNPSVSLFTPTAHTLQLYCTSLQVAWDSPNQFFS